MPKRGSHHWHVVVDERNQGTPAVVEHEHMVYPGRRHAHYHDYDSTLAGMLELGRDLVESRLAAMRLDGTAATTLDLDQPPKPQPDEAAITRSLHPEVRRSLS